MSITRLAALSAVLITLTSCYSSGTLQPTPDVLQTQTTGALVLRPTATVIASSLPLSTATDQSDVVVYRHASENQEGPDFQIHYASGHWELAKDNLIHKQLSGCNLWLAAHGSEVSPPKIEEQLSLGEYTWDVARFPNAWLSAYERGIDGGYYLFVVRYSAVAAADAVRACQEAAEAVIGTFELVTGK